MFTAAAAAASQPALGCGVLIVHNCHGAPKLPNTWRSDRRSFAAPSRLGTFSSSYCTNMLFAKLDYKSVLSTLAVQAGRGAESVKVKVTYR